MSKKAIKIFTDFLHHINVKIEALELTELLELLFFLHYEGKTKTSELEKKLADYLYDGLMEREMSDEKLVIVAHYLSMLDNPTERFEDMAISILKIESIKNIHVTFAIDSEPYLPIIKQGFQGFILIV